MNWIVVDSLRFLQLPITEGNLNHSTLAFSKIHWSWYFTDAAIRLDSRARFNLNWLEPCHEMEKDNLAWT